MKMSIKEMISGIADNTREDANKLTSCLKKIFHDQRQRILRIHLRSNVGNATVGDMEDQNKIIED